MVEFRGRDVYYTANAHGTYHYRSRDISGRAPRGRYVHAAHGDVVFVLNLNQYGSCCLRRRGYLLIQPVELRGHT